jgi:hypothetical protein
MAAATYAVTQGSVDVNKIWAKVRGPLQQALQFDCEEYDMADQMSKLDIDFSLREVIVPLDINEGYGVAAIAEGAQEAVPSTVNVEEITLPITEISARFTLSLQSLMLQNNAAAVVQKQLVYAGRKKMQDVARDYADRFYGFSTGILAQTTTVATASSGTAYTLANLYGVSGLGTAAQLADKFRVGDRVALVRSAALVTNAIGTITAISTTTPSITVTWNGSVTTVSGDNIVKANSMGNTVLGDTDYNKSIVGLLDAMTSSTVHSLATSSVPNWTVAYSDTTAGRFSGLKLVRARQEIANRGGGKASQVLMGQGVYRDLISLQAAALRFNDPFALEIAADIKADGSAIKATRRTPEGMVLIYDKSAYKRLPLPKMNGNTVADAIRMENSSGMIFPNNILISNACVNRRNMAYFQSQTTS